GDGLLVGRDEAHERILERRLNAGGANVAPPACTATALQRLDVRRGRALLALRHVEGDLLAFLERLVARALDGGVMGEEILAAVIRRDEAEALRVVEPLYGTCSHFVLPKSYAKLSELRLRARFPREGATAAGVTACGGIRRSDFTTCDPADATVARDRAAVS